RQRGGERVQGEARARLAWTLAASARGASCACAGGGSPESASTGPTSALPGSLSRVLRDRPVEVDRRRDDAVLFGDVRRRVALARAGALGPADEAEADLVRHDLH